MFEVSREIHFCYGHRLLNYEGKCKNLHGHNGIAVITVQSESLDNRGMVVDFAEIKQSVSQWIDDMFDHRLILHKEDPLAPLLLERGEPVQVVDVNPTAENIAKLIFDFCRSLNFPVVEVRLWETPSCFAVYRG
jgi:6-pyruvoyltetrahydropterin/6-carboxytetrahydropterin synthase